MTSALASRSKGLPKGIFNCLSPLINYLSDIFYLIHSEESDSIFCNHPEGVSHSSLDSSLVEYNSCATAVQASFKTLDRNTLFLHLAELKHVMITKRRQHLVVNIFFAFATFPIFSLAFLRHL